MEINDDFFDHLNLILAEQKIMANNASDVGYRKQSILSHEN